MNQKEHPKENNSNGNILKDYLFSQNVIKDSYSYYEIDNSFIVFKSINNILYLIYANKKFSIISYNLIDIKKINEIKNAHNIYITNFRHYLDNKNKKDLIISISSEDNNIKLWDISNWELLHNFENINKCGELYSAHFINDNNKNYIITSNSNLFDTEPLKIFDFNGNKIKEINDSSFNTFFIDIYYDKKTDIIYIITGNYGYAQSYDYKKNKCYIKYKDEYFICKKKEFNHIIIYDTASVIKLITSNYDGNIRIWDFHSGKLLIKYKICNTNLRGICLWNEEYLYVGCGDKEIKLIEIKNGKIIHCLKGHFRDVLNIKKINHPKYGQCLISKGLFSDYMILWNKI